ncbi:MAG: hypothetical protein AAGD14_12335, partial [Planctomycetota bacterium]
ALAEFPFMSDSGKRRLAEKMGEVTAARARLTRDARRALEDFDEFKDMASLDRVRSVLDELVDRHQVTSGEGPLGQAFAELNTAEAERRTTARRVQETKQAEPFFALASVHVDDEEFYSAAALLVYIVKSLPASEQADEARTQLQAIFEANPKIKRVIEDGPDADSEGK